MCGIAGVISREELTPSQVERVTRANHMLAHRGPDGEGSYSSAHVLLAMRRLDVVPQEAVYIGDSPFDIEAGQATGVRTVAVGWGIFPPVRLKEMEPDFYFEKPEEILGLCPEKV